MYFSHPECLPYSGIPTVYFILGNFVYVFQSPRVSSLFRDTDCLLYCGTRTVCIVQAPGVLKKTKCLPCYVTESVYIVMASVFTITAQRLPQYVNRTCLPWYVQCLHQYWPPKLVLICYSNQFCKYLVKNTIFGKVAYLLGKSSKIQNDDFCLLNFFD